MADLAAATLLGLDRLALEVDVAASLGTAGLGGRVAHSLLDLACHGEESVLDVGRVLCAGLEEGDVQAIGKLLQEGKKESCVSVK